MESPFINTCKHNTKETNHRICFILIALQFEYFTLKGGSFSLMRRRAPKIFQVWSVYMYGGVQMGRVCIRSDFVDSFCIVSSLISKYKFNSWICSWKRLQLNLPQDPILLEAPCKLFWGQLWSQLHPQRIQLPAFIVPTEKSSRFYDPIISDHKHGVHITAVDGATQMQSRLVYADFFSPVWPDSRLWPANMF